MATMNTLKRAAADFYYQSQNNATGPANISGSQYLISNEYVTSPLDDSGDHVYTIKEFVGGIAFSLVAKGDLAPSEATATDVANLCYALGGLVDRFSKERGLTLEEIGGQTVGERG